MLLRRFALIPLIPALFLYGFAQQSTAGAPPIPGLGKIIFPNSCAPAVQAAFLNAVAQLHSFQYAAAEKAFNNVIQADPQCAMAYWGLAMTAYHPLWEGVEAKAIKRGRSFLEKISKDWPETEREREYIAALGILFGPSGDDQRLANYSHAMAEISRRYPEDGEAQAFYALSLLAIPTRGDDTALRKQAIAILNRLTAAQPEHPGAVHYLIHAADTPELATQGLDAARRYAKIAPASSHALHMPAHIFVRLGLWQESIDSNLAAAIAAAEATEHHMGEAHYQFHAMDFLNYSYMQLGEEAKARRIIEDLNKVPGRSVDVTTNMRVNLMTRNLLELHHWKEALAMEPQGDAEDQQMVYELHVIAAARTGEVKLAKENLKNLEMAIKHDREGSRGSKAFRHQISEAWINYAQGKREKALKQMRAAANKEDSNDPGPFAVTAREMLADMLLEAKQPGPALAEYEAVLKLAPNRFNPLYGAARAAQLAGNAEKSKNYYSKLRENCPPQADREEMQAARTAAAGSN